MSEINTDRVISLYQQMAEFIDQNGFAPSIREVAGMLGIDSTSHAKYYIDRLVEWGWIANRAGTARTIRLLKPLSEIPGLAVVQAEASAQVCEVDGCQRHVWAGPAGMKFVLKRCKMHQLEVWQSEVDRDQFRSQRHRKRPANVDDVKRRTPQRKFLVVDHAKDKVVRFDVPQSNIITLGTVADADRLLPGYRATGHTVIEINEEKK